MSFAEIYIARHERFEAAEAYADRLSPIQIAYLEDNDGDFRLQIDSEGRCQLLLIEDEG
jgi:hypothetical protein